MLLTDAFLLRSDVRQPLVQLAFHAADSSAEIPTKMENMFAHLTTWLQQWTRGQPDTRLPPHGEIGTRIELPMGDCSRNRVFWQRGATEIRPTANLAPYST